MTHLQSALARNSEPLQRAALPPGDTLGRWAISGSHGVWHFPATAHLTPSVLEAPGCPCALENWEALPFYAKHSQQILTGISALRLLWCRFFTCRVEAIQSTQSSQSRASALILTNIFTSMESTRTATSLVVFSLHPWFPDCESCSPLGGGGVTQKVWEAKKLLMASLRSLIQ